MPCSGSLESAASILALPPRLHGAGTRKKSEVDAEQNVTLTSKPRGVQLQYEEALRCGGRTALGYVEGACLRLQMSAAAETKGSVI